MEKLQKICYTLILITALFPFLFCRKIIHHYSTLPDSTIYEPRIELLIIPLSFIILTFIINIWEQEIIEYLKNKK